MRTGVMCQVCGAYFYDDFFRAYAAARQHLREAHGRTDDSGCGSRTP